MSNAPKSFPGLDLSDVEFTTVTGEITTVTLEDHSNLGGPMGTESTSVLATYDFTNDQSALRFAKLLIARCLDGRGNLDAYTRDIEQKFNKDGYGSADCYAYGVSISRAKPAIGCFSYERMAKERTNA